MRPLYQCVSQTASNSLRTVTATQPQYWPTGELKHQYGARTYEVSYTYDSQGRRITMTTGAYGASGTGGATTTWNYDSATGQLSSKRYADNSGPSYTYTPAGRLQTRTWARTVGGIALTGSYTYNAMGGLASIAYSDGTPGVTFDYYHQGGLLRVIDATGERTFVNNIDGRPLSEMFKPGSIFAGMTIAREYDALLRPSTLTIQPPTGDPIVQTVTYDDASRVQTVGQGAVLASYTYEPNSSLIAGITLQNSGTTTMTTAKNYDHLNRLQSISSSVGSNVVSSHAYLYNDANQRTRATLADGSYWAYGYDELGQVTSGNRKWSDGAPVDGQQFGYAFDAIGNRTSTTTNGRNASYSPNNLNQYTQRDVPGAFDVVGSAAPTATVTVNNKPTKRHGPYFAGTVAVSNTNNPVNQPVATVGVKPEASGTDVVTTSTGAVYVAQTPESFSYDLDGNLTSDGHWTYQWDAENRLIQMDTLTTATNCVPNQRLKFTYDWQGRRSEKMLLQRTGTNDYATVSTTRFLYDGWNLIAELDGNNAIVKSYLWGLDLSGSPQGAGGVGGLIGLATTGSAAAKYFAIYDGNGNVRGLIDAFSTAQSCGKQKAL